VLSLWDGGGGAFKVTLQVAPEDLYQQARDFDSAADMVDQAIRKHQTDLRVDAAGADVISQAAAEWLTNSAFDGTTGALVQLEKTVQHFRDAAEAMRAAARSYNLQDTTTANSSDGSIGALKGSSA